MAVDIAVVASLLLFLRLHPFPDRKSQMIAAIALSGFIFQALISFEGAILHVQLATIAAVYATVAFCKMRI